MLFRIIQRAFNIYRGFQDSVKRATYSARIGFTTLYQGKNRPVVFKKTFDRMPTATVTIEASTLSGLYYPTKKRSTFALLSPAIVNN